MGHRCAARNGRGLRLHGTAAVTGSVTADGSSSAARLVDLYPGLSRAQVPGASAVSLS